MTRKILHIDASALGERSESRLLSSDFIQRWGILHPEDEVIQRDIVNTPLPHMDGFTLGSMMTPAAERTSEQQTAANLAEELVQEFLDTDVLVLGVPMYNLGIPSTLKAWVDHISVAGRTFEYTANGPRGLSGDKQVYILSTRGGVYGDNNPMEHQVSYMKTIFGFLGISDVHTIQAEGLNISPENRDQSIAAAHTQIQKTLSTAAA